MECRFTNCVFSGTAFPDCKFVECTFTNCQFLKDNLNDKCDFERAVAYGCRFENCVGFAGTEVSAPTVPVEES